MKIEKFEDLLKQKIVAVHDGPFHSDEVLCLALLRMLGYKGGYIRSRQKSILEKYVGIDVQDSATGSQFDHHGDAAEFGVCALTKLWNWIEPQIHSEQSARFGTSMHYAFQAVADSDSGAKEPKLCNNMFDWIRIMNDGSDAMFACSVQMAERILSSAWAKAGEWAATLKAAEVALKNAQEHNGVPVFCQKFAQAKEALYRLGCRIPFFVSPSGDGWAIIQCAPPDLPYSSHSGFCPLPKAWAGLRDEEFQKISGYKSARFGFNPGGGDCVMAFFGDMNDAIDAATKQAKAQLAAFRQEVKP